MGFLLKIYRGGGKLLILKEIYFKKKSPGAVSRGKGSNEKT